MSFSLANVILGVLVSFCVWTSGADLHRSDASGFHGNQENQAGGEKVRFIAVSWGRLAGAQAAADMSVLTTSTRSKRRF